MAKFCKYCGHILKESAKFCPGCGQQLVSSVPTSGTVPLSEKEPVSGSAVSQKESSVNRMAPPPLREKHPVREENINVRKQTANKKDPAVVAEVLLGIACLFLFIAIILTAPGRIKAAINGNLMSEGGQGMLLTGSDGKDEDGASGHKKNDDKKSGTKTGDEETDSDKNGSEEDTHGNYRWLYESQDMSEDHTE